MEMRKVPTARRPRPLVPRFPTGVLALGLLVAAAVRAEVPQVEIRQKQRTTPTFLGGGVSQPFFGTVDGERALFKRSGSVRANLGLQLVMRQANLEGEWLSSRLLREAGVQTPDVKIVQARPGAFSGTRTYAQVQHLDELLKGQGEIYKGIEKLPAGARLDVPALQRLQAMDLLIGNGDRHVQNLWFVKDPHSGLLRPVAFDHNLALGTKAVIGEQAARSNYTIFEQPMTRVPGSGNQGPVLSGGSRYLLSRNPLYQGAVFDPREALGLVQQARQVESSLSESRIRQLVAEIPDEAIEGADKAARRKELTEILLERRRNLVGTTQTLLQSHPDFLRSQHLLEGLPPRLKRHLPTTLEGRWRFVEALDGKGGFDRARLREALAEHKIPASSSSEIQRVLARQAPGRTPLQKVADLVTKPVQKLTGGGTTELVTPVKGVRTVGELTGQRSPWQPGRVPSFDFLEVRQGSEGLHTTGVGDGPVAPEGHPTRKVAEAALAKESLASGERLRVQKLPGPLSGYQAQVVDGSGEVVREGRYHTVGKTTIRTGKATGKSVGQVDPLEGGKSGDPRQQLESKIRKKVKKTAPGTSGPGVGGIGGGGKFRRPKVRIRGLKF